MRTIVSGTVNGLAFSLKEDGVTVCQESKYCSMISDCAKVALEKTKQEIEEGLYPTAVRNIAIELEKCPDADIQVSKAVEYKEGTTVVYDYHVPRSKDISKGPFLKGRFKDGKTFEVLADFSTQVWDKDGKLDKIYSTFCYRILVGMAYEYDSPLVQNKHCAIYANLKNVFSDMIVEQAHLYLFDLDPNMIY